MAKWIYIGGHAQTEHVSESHGNERAGVDMPDSTIAFGIKFIVNQPVDLTLESFKGRDNPAMLLRHALAKLANNRFFKPFAEDVEPEMVEPDKVRGKTGPKPKMTMGMSEGGVG